MRHAILLLATLAMCGCGTLTGMQQLAQAETLRAQDQIQRADTIKSMSAGLGEAIGMIKDVGPADAKTPQMLNLMTQMARAQQDVSDLAKQISDNAHISEVWHVAMGEVVGAPPANLIPGSIGEARAQADFVERARTVGRVRRATELAKASLGLGPINGSQQTQGGSGWLNQLLLLLGGGTGATAVGLLARRVPKSIREWQRTKDEDIEVQAKQNADIVKTVQGLQQSMEELRGALAASEKTETPASS